MVKRMRGLLVASFLVAAAPVLGADGNAPAAIQRCLESGGWRRRSL